MKAAILHKNGDPCVAENLSVVDNIDIPEPAAGEILVKVSAASINPVDWKLARGDFPGKKQGPFGIDVAGVVEKIGPDNDETTLKVGNEIYADSFMTQGSFAEYAVVKTVAASLKPKNIDMAQAAALPLVGLTAWQGLITHGSFQEGQKVCILGGSGGVGSLAVQMAKAMGASEVHATGSSVDMIKGFGADHVVNYKERPIIEGLKGKDFDIIFDTVGGYENWEAGQAGLKKGGKFITIVGDGGSLFALVAVTMWRKLMSLFGGPAYMVFLTNTSAPAVVEDMKKLTDLVESGKVKPVLDEQSFELTTESVHAMIKASMSHRTKGKLVLKVSN